jgi:3-hydroxy-D-aspartate aldolase
MNAMTQTAPLVVGLNVPAEVGMALEDVFTPALIIDLDAFEYNVKKMAGLNREMGVRHRAHAKTHKSAEIARYQIENGACGVCCQKVSEAEAIVDGGIKDVLVSNEVVDKRKIDRLARLAKRARVLVCVDDLGNVDDLSEAARNHGVTIECLVEMDCGAGRCGVQPGAPVVEIAQKIAASDNLKFSGLQAYQGAAQHVHDFEERKAKIAAAVTLVTDTIKLLEDVGLSCDIVGGAGTGSYYFEGTSKVYNEMQSGSYVFMDADYQRVRDAGGEFISEFRNSLFIWTSVMSKTKTDKAICDAGLKAQSLDSGLPMIFGRTDIEYIKAADEHGIISDPGNVLKLNEKLKLIPGHCDPTCNVYDHYVGIRDGKVECIWPVTARGLAY